MHDGLAALERIESSVCSVIAMLKRQTDDATELMGRYRAAEDSYSDKVDAIQNDDN